MGQEEPFSPFRWPIGRDTSRYWAKESQQLREQGYGFKLQYIPTGSSSLLYPYHPGEGIARNENFELRIVYWGEEEAEKRSIAQLPDGLTHIQNHEEVRSILEDIDYDDKEVFRSLFIRERDSGYEEIWACRHYSPFPHAPCWRIHG